MSEGLSSKHTHSDENRLADILHITTAKYLGTETFLSFDEKQGNLAEAEGVILGV